MVSGLIEFYISCRALPEVDREGAIDVAIRYCVLSIPMIYFRHDSYAVHGTPLLIDDCSNELHCAGPRSAHVVHGGVKSVRVDEAAAFRRKKYASQ
jgi:hypothetical protein